MTGERPGDRSDPSSATCLISKLKHSIRAPGHDLSQRIVHGGAWQLVERVASRAVNILQLIVLARLLDPEDFGLFGIALLTQKTLDVLFRFGIDSALIQRENHTERYLDTAWTLKVLRALIAGTCLLLIAPWVGGFFDAPRATPLIRVLAAIVLLQGLQNIGVIYFQKQLHFKKQFILRFGGAVGNALVAISIAWLIGSVWAFVAGMVAGEVVRLGISYAIHPYRPKLKLEMNKARDLWEYGKWLFGSTTLVYASTQGDDILLGRWLGATALGVYQVGYRISNAVATEIAKVISKVSFPAYAKLQAAEEKLRRGFLSTLSLTTLIIVPLAVAIAVFISDFVTYVIGNKWEAVIGPVRILVVAGLLRAFSACWGPLYKAQARTEKQFWKQGIRMILTLVPAYPLTVTYGIEGMAGAVVLGIAGGLIYDLFRAGAMGAVRVPVRAVLYELTGPTLATLGAVAVASGVRSGITPGLANFIVCGLVYIITYGGGIVCLEKLGWRTGWSRMVELLGRLG